MRSLGIGRMPAEQQLCDALTMPLKTVRLTLRALSGSHPLYCSAGFKGFAPYADNSLTAKAPQATEECRVTVLFDALAPQRIVATH